MKQQVHLQQLASSPHINLSFITAFAFAVHPSQRMAKYSLFSPIASIGELAVDWLETDKAHFIKVDVPGLTKEDLSLQILAGNVLQIAGVHSDGMEGEGWPHALERPRGSFLRQYKLPDNALLDKVQACDEDGVVTITIPKRKPLVRNIPIFVSKL